MLERLGLEASIVAADPASRARLPHPVSVVRGLADVSPHRPTLVLLPEPPREEDPAANGLLDRGVPFVVTSPHDLEEALALYEQLGAWLEEDGRGRRVASEVAAPFLARGSALLARSRPCLAIVVGADPLVLAGGHSFETDLLQALGAESVTHPGESWRESMSAEALRALAPDLVVVAVEPGHSEPAASSLRAKLAPLPVRQATLDIDALWLADPTDTLRVLGPFVELGRSLRSQAAEPPRNCALPGASGRPGESTAPAANAGGARDPVPDPTSTSRPVLDGTAVGQSARAATSARSWSAPTPPAQSTSRKRSPDSIHS
ncbi:MAG: hypothetical protein KC616_01575 [Myxococcales bacterium]|nr:hypothetical protein [Myxococcales bacterium]